MPDYSNHTDQELFRLIAEDDEQAFEQLFHRFVPKIQPLILSLVKTDAAVKDIIQEVFLSLWLGREKLPEIESPENWIFKIVYNRGYTWVSKKLIRERSLVAAGDAGKTAGSRSQTEEAFAFAETSRLLKQAVHALPPKAKRIYLLRETGLRKQEIARELGISVNTVKDSLFRSMQSIRAHLVRHGIELPMILILWMLKK